MLHEGALDKCLMMTVKGQEVRGGVKEEEDAVSTALHAG
jgi:hypothetical protein